MTPTPPHRSEATHTEGGHPASIVGAGLRTLVEGLNHPEGVCWSPTDAKVYAGGDSGELYRFGLDGERVDTVAVVPGGVMRGLAVDASRTAFVCDAGNGCIQRISADGRVRRHGGDIGYPNYPVFDNRGNLWVSDSGDWGRPTGAVVRIEPDGTTDVVSRGLHFANGLALRGDHLYVVESTWPRITRLPLAGGEAETVVELDEVVPDGLAFDSEGGLWISCWQPNRIYRLAPKGELTIVVDDWSGVYAPTPTNIAFAGAGLDVLVLASLGTDTVNACDPGFSGADLFHPMLQEGQ